MVLYNLTNVANGTTGIFSLVSLVNTELMGGYLGVLFLLVACSISFMTFLFSTNDTGKSLSASLFIGLGLSILLRLGQLIPDLAFFIIVIGCAASLAFISKVK